MKFVIATKDLNYLINKCQNVISPKPAFPLLGNFLIEAKGGEIYITATDLTIGVRCVAEAKVLEEGRTSVSAKKFASLVRELTAANLEMTTNSHHVSEVHSGTSRFKLHGMSPDEYPSFPKISDSVQINLTQKVLKDVLYRTSFAVSRDDNRYALTGVFMQIENGRAVFIGTDGKRLAQTNLEIKVDPSFTAGLIIPIKAVEEIIKGMEERGDVTLYILNDKIALETESYLFVTKLLSGDYPDVSRVIPTHSELLITLHREELMSLLRQIILFTPEEKNCSVRFSFTNGELRLEAMDSDVGEGKVSMPVNYHGPQFDIAFNPILFNEILRHNKGETVSLGLTDPFNPGLITDNIETKEGEEVEPVQSLFVLMPMRLTALTN